MYPGRAQAETASTLHPYGRPIPYSSHGGKTQAYPQEAGPSSRPPVTRPPLQASLSEASGIPRRNEAYLPQKFPPPGHRLGGPSLPGLRDILAPDQYSPSSTSSSVPWTSTSGPTAAYPNHDFPVLAGIHPPLVLQPPNMMDGRYSVDLDKSYNTPIVPANSLPRQSQGFPVSPTSALSNLSRDHEDARSDRHRHGSHGSYISNAASTAYLGAATDEVQYAIQTPASHPPMRSTTTLTGAEIHGKYLGVEEVPNDGSYHVYEDGYRCPTIVDGESVNPAWGLTKANKPRKRLALACLDCREKKIKCEPGGGNGSCSQCEKASRRCRRAPERCTANEETANTLYVSGSAARNGPSASDLTPTTPRDMEMDQIAKRRTRADASPPRGTNKKHRSTSPQSHCASDFSAFRREDLAPVTPAGLRASDARRKDVLSWEEDPYAVAPETTLELLDLYFTHINNAIYNIFPRKYFFDWLKRYPDKCQNERLLLYSMLAAVSVLADGHYSGFGKQCALIAKDAVASLYGRSNIAVASAKLLLGLYHSAKGANALARDYSGSAFQTITSMHLNTEKGCLDDSVARAQPRFDFYFTKEQLAECKRRTFWASFLQDRYATTTMCSIKPQDVFLRLPCTDEQYEHSIPSTAPFFKNDVVDPVPALLTPTSPVAPAAWLLCMAAIWGDVVDFAFRAYHRSTSSYREAYEAFYSETHNRAQGWLDHLPEYLKYNDANLDRSIADGYVGTLVSMHVLHHATLMRLNRYMRHAENPSAVSRNIRGANYHGHQVLRIVTALKSAKRDSATPSEDQPPICTSSTPFLSKATFSAIDVVSAGGLDSTLKSTMEEIYASLGVLRDLSTHWNSARDQLRLCETRYYQIKNVTTHPKGAKSGCWLGRKWGIADALEIGDGLDSDCIYGLGEREADAAMERYFEAFKEGEL